MKERRSLVDGLLPSEVAQEEKEKAFVYGTPATPEPQVETASPVDNDVPVAAAVPHTTYDSKILPQFAGRVPVTTRTRPEVATALKRASLTRQLNGIEPYYVQDIMEEALESWLRTNGYL
jgi:hypothetical protein